MDIEFVPYEGRSRETQKFSYEKFVAVLKKAIETGHPAVAVDWSQVARFIGATCKIHTFTARKNLKKFKDKKGNEYSIRDIESQIGCLVGGNREKNLFVVRKV